MGTYCPPRPFGQGDTMESLAARLKDTHRVVAGEVLFPPAEAIRVLRLELGSSRILGVDIWELSPDGVPVEDPGCLDLSDPGITDVGSRLLAKKFIEEMVIPLMGQIKFVSFVF